MPPRLLYPEDPLLYGSLSASLSTQLRCVCKPRHTEKARDSMAF